jgi:hypothetical protein
MPVRITPQVLPGSYSGDQTIVLSGRGSPAQAGNVTADTGPVSSLGRLSPALLHQAGYGNFAKQANTTVQVVGAEIRGQGEELEGSRVTVRLTGATAFAQAGIFEEEQIIISPSGGWGGINAYLGEQQREDKRKKDARKRYKKARWVMGPNGWTRADN